MATFRKRGSKWQVQVRRLGHATQSRTFHLKSDAQAWARKVERQLDLGESSESQQALKEVTLESLLKRYEKTITSQKRGAKSEHYRIRIILKHSITKLFLSNLTSSAIANYRDARLKTVKSDTVRRELGIIRHCLNIASTEWGIPVPINPVSQISIPKPSKPRIRRLQPGELQLLLSGCEKTKTPLLKEIIRFAIETGMRRGEILSIRWDNINFAQLTVFIPDTKNGYERTVPLTSVAIDILSNIPQNSEFTFPISSNALRLAWERLRKRVGIKDLRFHDLRHEAVSRFFEMGLSVPEVALISGHRDPRMLFRYTHLRAEDLAYKLNKSTPR